MPQLSVKLRPIKYSKSLGFIKRLRLNLPRLLFYSKFIFVLLFILFIIFNINVIKLSIDNARSEVFTMFSEALNLSLKEVYVEGQKIAKSEQIVEAVGYKIGHPILNIDIWDVKKRLEVVSFVKYAEVQRKLPDKLVIKIKEGVPSALWQHEGVIKILDEDGTIISKDDIKKFAYLPVITGEDAPIYLFDLFTIIKEDDNLFGKIVGIIRVGGRRWNIKFDDGLIVKLPEENVLEAWKYLLKLYRTKRLFNRNIGIIDLRIKDKIFITNIDKNG